MITSLRKITLVFFILAVLPVSYLVFELSSWNRNEKLIQEIYNNQLDAILYSINQYSDDLLSSWANKVNIGLSAVDFAAKHDTFRLPDVTSLPVIYLSDLEGNSKVIDLHHDEGLENEMSEFGGWFEAKNAGKIEKLISYFQAGFRKLEPIDTILSQRFVPVAFVLDNEIEEYRLAIITIDLAGFVQNHIGPKMQAIAGEKFIISAYRKGSDEPFYSTGNFGPSTGDTNHSELIDDGLRKEFWLLPDYSLGITLREASLKDLVNTRMTTSVTILVLLLFIIMFGMFFLYRNIRSEIKLSRAKTEFVSNVSHEIRTPLSLISMYAETLEMGRVPEEKKTEYYHIISKEAGRLSGIVNRILNFSRMDANKKEYVFRLIDLNALCEEVLRSYLSTLSDDGFTFDFNKTADIGPVEGDAEAIGEALINLIDNAMKYSRTKKHIVLATGRVPGYVYIEVKDEGIGIPKAYQKEIFEQFYRAPMGDVHHTKGSGLGLTLVKKTVEAHKGYVKVESTFGIGSTFRIYFPTLNKSINET